MKLDLLNNLTEIIRGIECSQQCLLDLRDPNWRRYMYQRHPHYQEVNTLSSDELAVVSGALEELDKCRLTLEHLKNKIIRNKIRVGEDATDK